MFQITPTIRPTRSPGLGAAARCAWAVLMLLLATVGAARAQETPAGTGADSLRRVQDSIIAEASRAIGGDSTLVDEYQKIVAIYKSRKHHSEQLQLAQSMAAANPRSAAAQFLVGDAQLDNSAPELAITPLQLALSLEPTFVRVHVTLAEAYSMMQSYDTALLHLDTAIRLNPRYAQAHVQRATILTQLGRDSAALDDLHAAAELLPDSFSPWLRLARAHRKLGNYTEAIDAAQYAMNLNAESPDALYLYAELLAKLERRNEAAQAFERFMLKFPTERRALEAERQMRELMGR